MKLKPGTIIEVTGWVMLKGLAPGLYRVAAMFKYGNQWAYTFTRKRGRKPICSHLAASVDGWIHGREDANRIEIVNKCQK